MSRLRCFLKRSHRAGVPAQILFFLAFFLCVPKLQAQTAWTVVGPAGGDARAFASFPGQPKHLLLGTTNSWLYESMDEGASWHRLAKLGSADGFVLDSIVVDSADSSTIYVGAWKDSDGGGLWISHDRGRTWIEPAPFKGQPVHALAQAPSDPRILYAGTLAGVFRSSDGGATWAQISPPGSHEIHEIESLAVDPDRSDTVYAGTWHLPWKTTDGGKTWHNIKQGLIVDSDVFSIIVDPGHTHIVYLSACSGIYKSENAGILFHKIQGIPSEARRTRSLMQDPENREVVYAGTTEGLYKTVNGGKSFERMTDSGVVVNGVYVDPEDSSRVLLATDRGGVLASQDGGVTFTPSNRGISERKVAALLVDRDDPERLYAGVVNDKNYGGVFRSSDGGAHWEQLDSGLDGRDVFALAQAKDGAVVAGTGHGIFVLHAAAGGDPAPAPPDGSAAALLAGPDLAGAERYRQHHCENDQRDAPWHARQHGEAGAGPGDRVAESRVRARRFGGRVGGSHKLRAAHQPRPGRQLAGRAGDGRGRLPFRNRSRRRHGRGSRRRRGSVEGRRAELVADGDPHDAHPHPPRSLLPGRYALAGRARGRLLHTGHGQDLVVASSPAVPRC